MTLFAITIRNLSNAHFQDILWILYWWVVQPRLHCFARLSWLAEHDAPFASHLSLSNCTICQWTESERHVKEGGRWHDHWFWVTYKLCVPAVSASNKTPSNPSNHLQIIMSRPPAGNYVIYNRVLSTSGEKLALTFNGQSQTVTVKPLDKNASQIVS